MQSLAYNEVLALAFFIMVEGLMASGDATNIVPIGW
jgi:energy-converting hydrogenase Eha subunit E